MEEVSLLGDSLILLPLALGLGVLLYRRGSPDLAAHWLRVLTLCVVGVAALKVAGHAVNALAGSRQIANVSGHVALAGLVYFSAALAWSHSPGRRAAAGLALIILALVAVSRVLLGAHDIVEVVGGGAIGLGGAVIFAGKRHAPCPHRRAWWSAAIAVCLGRAALLAANVEPEQLARLVGSAVLGSPA